MNPLNVSAQMVPPPKPLDRILTSSFGTQIFRYANHMSGMVNDYVSLHVPVFGRGVSAGGRCWTCDAFAMLLLVSSARIVNE
jgi:hypothetical protein